MNLRPLRLMTAALALSAATFTFAGTAAFAATDDTFDRTLTTGSSPDLYISTGAGSIRVHAGNDSQIHIVGHVHAGWSAGHDTEDRIRRIVASPPIEQSGNTIRVGSGNDDRGLFNNISIDYEIAAPINVALNLRSGSGDVEVDNLGRFLAAWSGSGSVRAHGLHGAAELQTGSGDIELEQLAPGGQVKAQNGSGSIRIHGLDGAFEAKTGSGDIEADGNLRGAAKLSSGSGSIRLHIQRDAHFNVEAETGSGNIRVNFPGAPQTDDNHLHLSGPVNGGGPLMDANTGSGDIEINPR